jgi:hypothetical protein
VPYFRIYDLRSTYATRLSAGGVADEWVTQMPRQGDVQVFKKDSQMKLQMKREALEKLNRGANEMPAEKQVIELARSACSEQDTGTVLARSRPEIMVRSGHKVGKYLRFSGCHELITPNRVVRKCELLVIGLRLFLGKIDHDDLRVFA